jgi:hypothetical protein
VEVPCETNPGAKRVHLPKEMNSTRKRSRFRWLWWLTPLILLAAGRIWMLNQEEPSPVKLGPHKTKFRWISFNDAHRKPWFDKFGLQYPKPGMAANLPPPQSPLVIAGYLVPEARTTQEWQIKNAAFPKDEFRFRTGVYWNMIPVAYAASAQEATQTLSVNHELIRVTLPFDPNKVPPRIQTADGAAPGFRLHATYIGYEYAPRFALKVTCADPKIDYLMVSYSSSAESGADRGDPATHTFLVQGDYGPDGQCHLQGKITVHIEDQSKRVDIPYKMTMPVRNLP